MSHDLEEVLKKHCVNAIVVETGTCHGRTVEFVLNNGAKAVRSVEGSRERYEACVQKFSGDHRVKLWNGFSSDLLWEMIRDVDEEMVFFLDAHPSGPESYGHDEIMSGKKRFRQSDILKEEIDVISRHPIKSHTIILDDQHNSEHGLRAIEDFKQRLLQINPEYRFSVEKKNIDEETACCLVAEII